MALVTSRLMAREYGMSLRRVLGNLLASEALASIRTNVRKDGESEAGDLPIWR